MVKKKRTSAKDIIPLIIKSISREPKSIHTISEEVGTNWTTAKTYLESLKKAELLKEGKQGKKRVFSICQDRESILNVGDFTKELKIVALYYAMHPKAEIHAVSEITEISEEKVIKYKLCLFEINFFEYIEMQQTFWNIKKFGRSIFDDIKKKDE